MMRITIEQGTSLQYSPEDHPEEESAAAHESNSPLQGSNFSDNEQEEEQFH